MIKVSAIVCHHQGDLVYGAIRTLLESRNVEFEIIVVTSIPNLQFESVRTLHLDGEPAKKRNYGVRCARGSLVAFFDDDVEVDRDCLAEQAKLFDDQSVGMTFGKLKNMEFRDRFDEAGSYLTWSGFLWARAESGVVDTGQFEKIQPVLAGKSASCMIRRSLYNKLDGMDEAMGILGEETDLAWRVWLSGQIVLYAPQSLAYHAFNTKFKPQSFYTPKRVYYNGCRNYITMLLKNLEARNLWKILPFHILIWILAGFGMACVGKWSASGNIFRGLLYVIDHALSIAKKRKSIQQGRLIRDQELFLLILRQPSWRYYLQRFARYIKVGLHG